MYLTCELEVKSHVGQRSCGSWSKKDKDRQVGSQQRHVASLILTRFVFIYKNDLYNFVRHFKKEGVGNVSYACFWKGNIFEVG